MKTTNERKKGPERKSQDSRQRWLKLILINHMDTLIKWFVSSVRRCLWVCVSLPWLHSDAFRRCIFSPNYWCFSYRLRATGNAFDSKSSFLCGCEFGKMWCLNWKSVWEYFFFARNRQRALIKIDGAAFLFSARSSFRVGFCIQNGLSIDLVSQLCSLQKMPANFQPLQQE